LRDQNDLTLLTGAILLSSNPSQNQTSGPSIKSTELLKHMML